MRRALALFVCLFVGCSLDARGTAPDDDLTPDDGGSLDTDVPDTTTPPDTADTEPPIDSAIEDSAAADTTGPDTALPDTALPDTAPTDASPAGFTVVTRVTGACPSGWDTKRVLLASPRDPGTGCTCSCGSSGAAPCQHDTLTINYRTGTSNCNDGTQSINADGMCRALPAWPMGTNGANGTPVAAKATTCPATATLTPLAKDGSVDVCVASTASPPDVSTPVCFLRDGDVDCPTGAPNKQVLVPQSRVMDGRKCGACSCTSQATVCTASLSFFSNDKCTMGTRTVTLDSTCNGISGMGPASHYRYSGTPNTLTCAPASPTVTTSGSVSIGMSVTLCCP